MVPFPMTLSDPQPRYYTEKVHTVYLKLYKTKL